MRSFILALLFLGAMLCLGAQAVAQSIKKESYNQQTIQQNRVVCQPIKLANAIQDATQLEQLLRAYMAEYTKAKGFSQYDFTRLSIIKKKQVWYAHFMQTIEGNRIVNSELTFRVHENGNLFLYGLKLFPVDQLKAGRALSQQAIDDKLKQAFPNASYSFFKKDEAQHYYVSVIGETYSLKPIAVYELHQQATLSDVLLVDLSNGNIVEQIPQCFHANISGMASGDILPLIPTENQVNAVMPHLNLLINGQSISSDSLGAFMATLNTNSANISASLKGLYLDVQHFNQDDASIALVADCEEEVAIHFNDDNSSLSERNVYYHINFMHDYNKRFDPSFTALDYPLPCIVNDDSALCNAYWNGTSLHFNTQGSGCSMNSAHGASVIYHEYGHATNDHLYLSAGAPFGLKSPILHEAFADIYSTLLLGDNRFALGWFGPGTFTRNVNNNNRYPGSIVGQQHTDGLILGGAFWDLGQLIGPEKAYELSHFAKYGLPDDSDVAVAFTKVYLETLVADDDDGNLLNGTPNSAAIEQAFCQHGIGADLFVSRSLNHAPYPDVSTNIDGYDIEASIPVSSYFTQAANEITLHYSTNNFQSTNTLTMETEQEGTFSAIIPQQVNGSLVKYFFRISDNACGEELVFPSRDFTHEYFNFTVGDYTEIFRDDFENDQGWNFSYPGDNAASGRWERGNPQEVIGGLGFLVTPEDDHSEAGNQCLVTGAIRGTFWYSNDVDNGKTTVVSPIFNNLNESSVFTFYKWFVHGAGFIFPVGGRWQLEVTNDGQSWIPIEDTAYGDHRYWIKGSYKFSDYLAITEQVQLRIIVSDVGAGSIVEGLLDDFTIKSLNSSVATYEYAISAFALFPNPATELLNIQVFDTNIHTLQLQVINTKGQILLTSSQTTAIDVSHLSDGVYFLRLVTANGSRTKKFLKI